jgi:hypothetical protein
MRVAIITHTNKLTYFIKTNHKTHPILWAVLLSLFLIGCQNIQPTPDTVGAEPGILLQDPTSDPVTVTIQPTNDSKTLALQSPMLTSTQTPEMYTPTEPTGRAKVLTPTAPRISVFDGQAALEDISYQVNLGPRTIGSPAHLQTGDWIASELSKAGWEVSIQELSNQGKPIRNIIGKLGQGEPWIILGAHYDTRFFADRDPVAARQLEPVPGANDGASGVAVLLELARKIPGVMAANTTQEGDKQIAQQIWLVFFDAEDNGNIPGWNWAMGSEAFVASLVEKPVAAIIVDMVGDRDLTLFFEKNSDQALNQEIWESAAKSGYAEIFIPEPKRAIIDDHQSFLSAGIPAIDIIDLDYPDWHTTGDTVDKVSADSLQAIGDTLIHWLSNGSSLLNRPE